MGNQQQTNYPPENNYAGGTMKHPKYNYTITPEGKVISSTGKEIAPRIKEDGYVLVTLWLEGKSVSKRVHRLVAQTYLPNPENKPEVNHIDCDKSNNHFSNLEWVTSKENKEHAWRNGLYDSIGEKHFNTKLTDDEVRSICISLEEGKNNTIISEETGVPPNVISQIRIGATWGHISKDYDISKKVLSFRTEEDVLRIAELLMSGNTDTEISKETGDPVSYVTHIRYKKSFKSLLEPYDFPPRKNKRLSEKEVREACELLSQGLSTKEVCDLTSFRKDQVQKIKNRRSNLKISSEYSWQLVCSTTIPDMGVLYKYTVGETVDNPQRLKIQSSLYGNIQQS